MTNCKQKFNFYDKLIFKKPIKELKTEKKDAQNRYQLVRIDDFFSYFTYSGDVIRHLLSLNMIAFIV